MLRRDMLALLLTVPAMAVFGAKKELPKMRVKRHRCVGCGDCVLGCPKKAIVRLHGKAVIDTDKCVGCRNCIGVCSYGAIQ